MEQEKKQPDVRLIGLDLDGTTLTSDKVLTPHTKEVLEKCLCGRDSGFTGNRKSKIGYSRVFNTD